MSGTNTTSKHQEDAKKWFDRSGLENYLSALTTSMIEKRPEDPKDFMLKHLIQFMSKTELAECGFEVIEGSHADHAGLATETDHGFGKDGGAFPGIPIVPAKMGNHREQEKRGN